MDFVDSFGNLIGERDKVEKLYHRLKSLKEELNLLEAGERERAQKEDLLRFQKRKSKVQD